MDAKGLVVDVPSSPPQSHGQWQASGKNGVELFLVIIIHSVSIHSPDIAQHPACARGYSADQDTAYRLRREKYTNQIHNG